MADTRKLVSLRLDTELHRKLKVMAAEEGITLQDYLSTLIQKDLKKRGIDYGKQTG